MSEKRVLEVHDAKVAAARCTVTKDSVNGFIGLADIPVEWGLADSVMRGLVSLRVTVVIEMIPDPAAIRAAFPDTSKTG